MEHTVEDFTYGPRVLEVMPKSVRDSSSDFGALDARRWSVEVVVLDVQHSGL